MSEDYATFWLVWSAVAGLATVCALVLFAQILRTLRKVCRDQRG